jgi:hypothetical protein
MGVGTVFIFGGLAVWLSSIFIPLIQKSLYYSLMHPVIREWLLDLNIKSVRTVTQSGLWYSIILFYGVLAGLSYSAYKGGIKFLYNVARYFLITALCLVGAVVIERLFETMLNDWNIFENTASHILWVSKHSPVLLICVALISLIFSAQQTPKSVAFWAIGFYFLIWLVQILFVGVVLGLLGGALGLLVNAIYSIFSKSTQPLLWEMGPSQLFSFIGANLGFIVGIGYFIIRWLKGDLVIIVETVRRIAERIFTWIENWHIRILNLNAPRLVLAIYSLAGFLVLWFANP